eukprot:GHRR01001863.1.p1 GENE.GHRR01001863.1~~GHRR01001863.1.p1  ORF type:complete len:213 (+),score=26.03 GHRR01001863.1:2639-3277(+)
MWQCSAARAPDPSMKLVSRLLQTFGPNHRCGFVSANNGATITCPAQTNATNAQFNTFITGLTLAQAQGVCCVKPCLCSLGIILLLYPVSQGHIHVQGCVDVLATVHGCSACRKHVQQQLVAAVKYPGGPASCQWHPNWPSSNLAVVECWHVYLTKSQQVEVQHACRGQSSLSTEALWLLMGYITITFSCTCRLCPTGATCGNSDNGQGHAAD